MSEPICDIFVTKPLPPSGFQLLEVGNGWKIGWTPSLTPYVTHYKIRLISNEVTKSMTDTHLKNQVWLKMRSHVTKTMTYKIQIRFRP
jgi:hypothetical protein